jgi:hypothetical protein
MLRTFEFLLAKVGPLQVGNRKPRANDWLHSLPRQPLLSSPPGLATVVGRTRQALRELRGGGWRRPRGRRQEAVPQFVSNQGVRAVPRAGQQCVNKPTATPPPPWRARPASVTAAAATAAATTAGSAALARARPPSCRAGPAPSPAPLAPPSAPPRPRRRGLPHLPPHARARSRTTRLARIVASREQGKGDARGPRRGLGPARPEEVSGVTVFRWAGEGGGPGRPAILAGWKGPRGAVGHKLPNLTLVRAGGLRGGAGGARRGAGRCAGKGRAPRNFLLPRGAPASSGRGPDTGAAAPGLEGDHEMSLKKLTQFVTLSAS